MSRVCGFASRRHGSPQPPALVGAPLSAGLGPYGRIDVQAAPRRIPPQGPTPASSVSSKVACLSAPGGPSLQVPGLKEPFPISRGQEARDAAFFAASAATGFRAAPQASAFGASGGEELMWPQSFGDISAVVCHSEEATETLRMPAQLRPTSQWEPATPCGGEEPPAYDAFPVIRPSRAPGILAPPPGRPQVESVAEEKRRVAQVELPPWTQYYADQDGRKRLGQRGACTQPFASAPGEDFVYGGLDISRFERLPTPVRSCYSGGAGGTAVGHQDAAVQANRHSIDGHNSAAAAAAADHSDVAKEPTTRKRLASIIRQTGAPQHYGDDSAGIDAGSPAKNIRVSGASSAGDRHLRELRYPEAIIPMDVEGGHGGAGSVPVAAWQGRVKLAQVTSAAISEEVAELERAWGLGGSTDDEKRAEQVMALFLRKIAKFCGKACVMEALKPAAVGATALPEAPQDSAAQHDLEAEIIAAEERIATLKRIEEELEQANEAEVMCKDVQEVVESLCSGSGMPPPAELEAAEGAGRLEQCIQRLAVADLWVHHTVQKLKDYDRDCAEREHAVAAKGWYPRSGEGAAAAVAAKRPNGQRVLAGLR
mmetsp:Transcript_134483/g.287725  ORF Transcript_134483/g.287725 Transcript_134483/m.287725 type:complete len:596 (+) Transcript_134483:69-1856(+)